MTFTKGCHLSMRHIYSSRLTPIQGWEEKPQTMKKSNLDDPNMCQSVLENSKSFKSCGGIVMKHPILQTTRSLNNR